MRSNMELHRKKVARFVAHMRARGFRHGEAAPPLFRCLWALGLSVPPPLFLGFVSIALPFGAAVALLVGVAMALFDAVAGLSPSPWLILGLPVPSFVVSGIVAGTSVGLTTAVYYRRLSRRLRLGAWETFPAA